MWASLLVWWLRICLEMQGTPVQSLVWEDSTCPGATKPVHPNYWASALPPTCYNYWASVLQLLKPMSSRACAPKPEKPLQWEAHALLLESSPQLRKATFTARPTTAPPKIKIFKFIFLKKDTMQIPIWRFGGGVPQFLPGQNHPGTMAEFSTCLLFSAHQAHWGTHLSLSHSMATVLSSRI